MLHLLGHLYQPSCLYLPNCQDSGLALLAKCSLIPNLFSAFASISSLFSPKAKINPKNNPKLADLLLCASRAFFFHLKTLFGHENDDLFLQRRYFFSAGANTTRRMVLQLWWFWTKFVPCLACLSVLVRPWRCPPILTILLARNQALQRYCQIKGQAFKSDE